MSEPNEYDTLPPSMDPAAGGETKAPPRGFTGVLRCLGPGLIIAGSIVGSGELIATTKTGAQAGINLLWLVIVGCLIKVFVQLELGRFTISAGETTLGALNQLPGRIGRANWILWFWSLMTLCTIGQLGGIVGGVGQSLSLTTPITGDYQRAIATPETRLWTQYVQYDGLFLSEWDLALAANPDATTDNPQADAYIAQAAQQAAAHLATLREHAPELADNITEHSARIRELQASPDTAAARDKARLELRPLLAEANSYLTEIDSSEAALEFRDLLQRKQDRIIRSHGILAGNLADLDRKDRRAANLMPLAIALHAEPDSADAQAALKSEIDPYTYDDKIWSGIIAVFTAFLLYWGRYNMIQSISTVLVVTFTFITIGNVFSLQSTETWHIPLEDFLRGLSFGAPEADGGANPWMTALATFGIIGVGASELVAYPYWCLEKGYARFTGARSDDQAWVTRAQGWIRVMYYDAFASMIVYTVATLAFFLMGVAVLYNDGLDPDGMRMVSTLAEAYVPVFGPYAKWLFLCGAVAVLYSTYMVANAGNARMVTDAIKVFGFIDKNNEESHQRMVRFMSALLPLLCFAVYVTGANPVTLVLIAGTMQATMLPILGFSSIYFRYKLTDQRLAPTRLWDYMLWISSLGLLLAGAYGIYSRFT